MVYFGNIFLQKSLTRKWTGENFNTDYQNLPGKLGRHKAICWMAKKLFWPILGLGLNFIFFRNCFYNFMEATTQIHRFQCAVDISRRIHQEIAKYIKNKPESFQPSKASQTFQYFEK